MARGAPILAEVLGAGDTADAHHITAPSPGGAGAIACMEQALDDAGLTPADIGQINAHGTSTPRNDEAEAEAIAKVFGAAHAAGHLDQGRHRPLPRRGRLAGGGGRGQVPAHRRDPAHDWATAEADPDLAAIDIVTEPRSWTPAPTLSNSFGFGGHNGCLIVGPAS